jgi:hypothetical protein
MRFSVFSLQGHTVWAQNSFAEQKQRTQAENWQNQVRIHKDYMYSNVNNIKLDYFCVRQYIWSPCVNPWVVQRQEIPNQKYRILEIPQNLLVLCTDFLEI